MIIIFRIGTKEMRTVKEQVLQAAVRSQPLRDAVDKTAEQLLAETANVRAAQSLLMQLQVSFIFHDII